MARPRAEPIRGAAVAVEGLRELQRAFRLADKTLNKELRIALRHVADPVAADAEQLALSEITRINVPPMKATSTGTTVAWWKMRVGVTQKLVYVAPKQRGVKSRGRDRFRRDKFADILGDKAMGPALDRNVDNIVRATEQVLETVGKAWEHG